MFQMLIPYVPCTGILIRTKIIWIAISDKFQMLLLFKWQNIALRTNKVSLCWKTMIPLADWRIMQYCSELDKLCSRWQNEEVFLCVRNAEHYVMTQAGLVPNVLIRNMSRLIFFYFKRNPRLYFLSCGFRKLLLKMLP